MGSYVFTWSQPASEVYVTGTFDDWKKTVKLEKQNGVFTRQVDLPFADKNILYKFVVDNDWTVDSSKPLESDESGNVNNLLKPSDITLHPSSGLSSHGAHPAPLAAAAATLVSGVMPGTSTNEMAGQVPLEKKVAGGDAIPGTFPPETPGEELSGKPTSASLPLPSPPVMFAPGDITDFSTYTNDVPPAGDQAKSGEQTFSVNPLPATAGTGNPINLKPGEPVPHSTVPVDHAVKTDQASYEKSDAYPGSSGKALDTQAGAFGVAPVTGPLIPESSLPMGSSSATGIDGASPFVQSTGAGTTTAALAGQVPKEPRGEAHVEKDDESEPASGALGVASAAGGAVAGVAAGAAAMAAGVPASIQNAISSMTGGVTSPAEEPKEAAADVPEAVKHAQTAAQASPEASGNTTAVAEKSEVEKELLDKIPRTEEAGEPASASAAAQYNVAPKAQGTTKPANAFSNDPTIADDSTAAAIAAVNTGPAPQPAAFKDDPVAAGESGQPTAPTTTGLNAAATTPAKSTATETRTAKDASTPSAKLPGSAAQTTSTRHESRDVSPKSKPTVTSGIESATTPSKQGGTAGTTGASSATASQSTDSTPTDKKAKRKSFFGKIKEKLKN